MANLIYWDSMCFIYRLSRNPDYIAPLEAVLQKAEAGEIVIVTSVFSMAEVAQVAEQGTSLTEETQEKLILDFFENDFIYVVPFDENLLRTTRGIVRKCKLKGKDAVHVATAMVTPNVYTFHTNDTDVIKRTSKIENCKIRVQTPSDWLTSLADGQMKLDMVVD